MKENEIEFLDIASNYEDYISKYYTSMFEKIILIKYATILKKINNLVINKTNNKLDADLYILFYQDYFLASDYYNNLIDGFDFEDENICELKYKEIYQKIKNHYKKLVIKIDLLKNKDVDVNLIDSCTNEVYLVKEFNTKKGFKYKLKKAYYITLLAGVTYSLIRRSKLSKADKVFKVSNEVFSQLRNISSDDIYLFDDSSIKVNPDNIVYTDVTHDNLSKIKKLNVMANGFNFEELNLLPNLESLTIKSCSDLSDEEKSIIKDKTSIKTLRLFYDSNDISFDDKLDLDWCGNRKIEIYNLNLLDDMSDIDKLKIYNLYKNIPDDMKNNIKFDFISEEEMNQMNEWNSKLEKIVGELNISSSDDDLDKIIKIVKYVTDKYQYDPKISRQLSYNEAIDYDLVEDYNMNLLSNLLESDNDLGICCNYAALTSILGFYCNLNVDYIAGSYGKDDDAYGHAWCTYNYNGENKIIDSTFIDGNSSYEWLDNIYFSNLSKKTCKDDLIKEIFKNSDDTNYNEQINVTSVENKGEKNEIEPIYYNVRADEYNSRIRRQKSYNQMLFLITGLLLAVGVKVKFERNSNEKKEINKVLNMYR